MHILNGEGRIKTGTIPGVKLQSGSNMRNKMGPDVKTRLFYQDSIRGNKPYHLYEPEHLKQMKELPY